MQATSRVTIFQPVVRQLTSATNTALEMTTEALHTEIVSAGVVPFDIGTLQGEGMSVDYSKSSSGSTSIVHSTPYARRLYYHPEYNFQTTTNAHAKGKWFEDWLPGGKNDKYATETYKKFYKKLTGV